MNIPTNIIQGLMLILVFGLPSAGTLLYVISVNDGDNWSGVPWFYKAILLVGSAGCFGGTLIMMGML